MISNKLNVYVTMDYQTFRNAHQTGTGLFFSSEFILLVPLVLYLSFYTQVTHLFYLLRSCDMR